MRKLTQSFLLLISAPLISCSTTTYHIPGVYRIDIQQGNIFDQNMIDQLRPNMTKRQVLYVLGSPMLVDLFHKNRWDYIYSEDLGGKQSKQQRISLFFENDFLTGVQGDYKPNTLPVARVNTETTVVVPKRQEKKTVFGEIVKFFSFDDDEPTPKKEIEPDNEEQIQPDKLAPASEPKSENVHPSPEETDSNQESIKDTVESISENGPSPETEETPTDAEQKIAEQMKAQEEAKSNKMDELTKPPGLRKKPTDN